MIIDTKFDIGQKVYYLSDNKIEAATIAEIYVDAISHNVIDIRYHFVGLPDSFIRDDSEVFTTREELIESLLNNSNA